MFWIYRDDFAAADEIDYGFVHENQTVSAERGGRARIAFPDPAGGAGQNWRADRSSTTRSISAADRRITAHRDPIARTTKVNPLGIYSSSKAAGGRPVCEAVATHMILRTAWIYVAHGQNLVKAILRLAGERPRLRVVADQLADGNAR